jgi:hypothetical protein
MAHPNPHVRWFCDLGIDDTAEEGGLAVTVGP